MNTLERNYRDFQRRRLLVPVQNLTPEHSEKMDTVEQQLWEKVLATRHLTIMDGKEVFLRVIRGRVNPHRLLTAQELKNPVTLQSYITRGMNQAKKIKKLL